MIKIVNKKILKNKKLQINNLIALVLLNKEKSIIQKKSIFQKLN